MNKNVLLDPFRVLDFFLSKNASVLGTPCSYVLPRLYSHDTDLTHVCSFFMTLKNLLFLESCLSR